jgi:hypothetical protein
MKQSKAKILTVKDAVWNTARSVRHIIRRRKVKTIMNDRIMKLDFINLAMMFFHEFIVYTILR